MSLTELINMFKQVNKDCRLTGETVVKMNKDNVDYYMEQCSNLEIDPTVQQEFKYYLMAK